MVLDHLRTPIVLAPMAGGPSTPALAAAVSEAGALGFLAAGYLSPERLTGQLAELRSLTSRPFGVNVFSPPAALADPQTYSGYVATIRDWAAERGLPVGEPAFGDDHYAEKIEMLVAEPAAAVSFTFGAPDPGVVERLRAAGSEVWVTVTSPDEAAIAIAAGADVLVVQGAEAGGHQARFDDDDAAPVYSLLSLLQLLGGGGLPLVAAGGIMSGRGVAAVLKAGAQAAQLGTAFLLCPEAGTSAPHCEAIRRGDAPTRLTRAYTGRTARGIANEFMADLDGQAVIAYPEIHFVTQPLRQAAREAGNGSAINLWAGEAYPLARELPAAELVAALTPSP